MVAGGFRQDQAATPTVIMREDVECWASELPGITGLLTGELGGRANHRAVELVQLLENLGGTLPSPALASAFVDGAVRRGADGQH